MVIICHISQKVKRFPKILKILFHEKRISAKLLKPFYLLAQRRGFAPLAARPAQQLLIVDFAVGLYGIKLGKAKHFALAKWLPPSKPLQNSVYKQKKKHQVGVPFLWRREEDLNLRYVSGVHTISKIITPCDN